MFKITRDLTGCDGETGSVGRVIDEMPLYGMERLMGVSPQIPIASETVRFRMFDDDGELYYEGELDDDADCENQSAALRWGETMGGCTLIEVMRNGTWTAEIC